MDIGTVSKKGRTKGTKISVFGIINSFVIANLSLRQPLQIQVEIAIKKDRQVWSCGKTRTSDIHSESLEYIPANPHKNFMMWVSNHPTF